MPAIVGSRADSATRAGQWEGGRMDVIVLILLILSLVGIVAAALMTIGVALGRKQG
ncbi:MAG: hypothetical protein QM747_05510 [Nocardioides sp.]